MDNVKNYFNARRIILPFLISAMLIVSLMPLTASTVLASDQISGYGEFYSYTLTENSDGNGTYTAVIDKGSSDYPVVSLTDSDLSNERKGKITRVAIADGVGGIDKKCFSGFTALQYVELPDTLHTIGDHAFSGCLCLQDLEIPDSVESIGESALSDTCCIPSGITLPEQCDAYGDPLETAKIFYDVHPDAVSPDAPEGTSYLDQFEESYEKITEILSELGVAGMSSDLDKITAIYDWITDNVAFDNNAYHFSYPDQDYARQRYRYAETPHCALMDGVALSPGYSDLLETMLKESGIRSIEFADGKESWVMVELNGVWYAADPKLDAGLEILDYVYFLRNYDFFYEFGHNWEFPDGFTNVYPITDADYARVTVNDCECLIFPGFAVLNRYKGSGTSVTLPQTVEYKGTEYPVTRICGNAFYEDNDLQEIVIPAGYESIGLAAFNNCSGLEGITLPAEIGEISYAALFDTSVSYINYDGTSEQLLGTDLFRSICRSFDPEYINCTDKQCPNPYCLMNATISFSPEKAVYNGYAQVPDVTVTAADGTVLTRDEDYSLYLNDDDCDLAKKVDRYSVCVEGIGDYYGSLYSDDSFVIQPKAVSLKSLKRGKRKMTVRWYKKTEQVQGYEIQYARDKAFTQSVKTRTIKKNKTTSCTIKKLKKKKRYYVRIRTYKTGEYTGETFYSEWSKVKSVKVK